MLTDYSLIFIIFLILIVLLYMYRLSINLSKLESFLDNITVPNEENKEDEVSSDVRDQLSSYELERLEREDNFDQRIARLKDELADTKNVLRHGINAEETHPLVKNLPHNIISDKHGELPDVEYID